MRRIIFLNVKGLETIQSKVLEQFLNIQLIIQLISSFYHHVKYKEIEIFIIL